MHVCVFFLPNTILFRIFWGYLGLKRSEICEEILWKTVNGLAGTHRTRVQSGSISKKRRGRLDFCAENTCNLGTCSYVPGSNYLVAVWNKLWALNVTWCWLYAVRSSNICVKRFHRHALEWLQSAHSEKMWKKLLFSSGNAWQLLNALKGCGRWGHVFATILYYSASLGPWTKTTGCVTLFHCLWAVSMILNNMWRLSRYCMRHSWAISLNQLVEFLKPLRTAVPCWGHLNSNFK